MSKNNRYIIYFVLISILGHIQAQTDVVCIGNSITLGVGLSDRINECYPSQLGVLLGGDFDVENRGEGGATLLKNTWKPYIGTSTWEFSIATHHDIVIILLGTNDSDEIFWVEKDHFKDDYFELMDDYKNYPGHEDPVFILGLPPPVFDESAGHRNEPIVSEIIPMIKQIAYETGSTIADFYNALDGKPELFLDGVHPNAAGATIMAEVAYNAIQEALHVAYPPPNIPTGLKTIPGEFNINLEWHANTEDDLLSYDIYRGFEEGGFQHHWGITYAPDTTFSDYTDIIVDHVYYYSIDAKNTHNIASSRSAPIAGKTIDHTPPNSPVNLQAILEADSVKLSWTPNTELDLDKYYIYRNTLLNDIQQDSSIIGTVYAPKSNFIDRSYDPASNYYYGVKAIDISGNQGPISNVVNITTKSRPLSSDTTLTLNEDVSYHFIASDFPFFDADNDFLDKIIFIDTNHFEYFSYNGNNIDSTIICNDISKLTFTPKLDDYGLNYAEFSFRAVDSFGSTSIDTNIVTIHINDKPRDFNIITPISDSTLVINKSTYLNTFSISWEESSDSISEGILYDIIFTGDLSALSQYRLNSTNTDYILKNILSITDTVSIATGTFSVFATDGNLETGAINGNIALIVDGRSFAPAKLHLDQNYPNPFNNTTVIGFDLPKSTDVSIIIYDLLGEEVIKLVNNKKYERGYNTVTWNGLDKHNNLITAGIYIMQIRMGSNEQHKKLVYIK